MSTDETSPVTGRPPRVRRERGVTETLLSIVLALEAVMLFFGMLAANGLTDIPTVVVVGGGAAAIGLFIVVAMLQRYPWGVVLGGVLQVALIATGLLVTAMYIVGVVFATFWIWCLVRARRIERSRPSAAEGVGA